MPGQRLIIEPSWLRLSHGGMRGAGAEDEALGQRV
jgi:hypothetical protein